MSIPAIISIVEGDGEEKAVPLLLRRLLAARQRDAAPVIVGKCLNARGGDNLKSPEAQRDLGFYLRRAVSEENCAAILVLVDADEDCASTLARGLAARVQAQKPSVPVAVVCAKHEYETWFVASLGGTFDDQIRKRLNLAADLTYPDPVEALRSPKGWLNRQMPQNRRYKETEDQVALTAAIDFERVRQRSRSFRRLEHAVDELLDAIDQKIVRVTPQPAAPPP